MKIKDLNERVRGASGGGGFSTSLHFCPPPPRCMRLSEAHRASVSAPNGNSG